MAIVNITEDSFSDGGLYIDLPSAINHASLCIKQGAHILDIGAQSTRPGASEVGPEIEIKRLVPLIKELKLSINCLQTLTYHTLFIQKNK